MGLEALSCLRKLVEITSLILSFSIHELAGSDIHSEMCCSLIIAFFVVISVVFVLTSYVIEKSLTANTNIYTQVNNPLTLHEHNRKIRVLCKTDPEQITWCDFSARPIQVEFSTEYYGGALMVSRSDLFCSS